MAERRRRGSGEGGIYQLPDGSWQGSVELGWVNGKRRRRQIKRRTRQEVARELRQLIAQAEAGRLTPDKPPTVAEWMATYLREVAPGRVRPGTLHSYQQHTDVHIVPSLGRYRLDKLRPQHIAAFYREKSQVLAPSSVRRLHAVLRRALTVAVRWGLISANPALMVDPPAVPRVEVKPYSVAEARTFLAQASGDRLRARWFVGISMGLRQGETLGLLWSDVDFDKRLLHVRRALRRQPDGSLALVRTKTSGSDRTIPMPAPVVDALRDHRDRQLKERELLGDQWWSESDLVFTTSLGTPIHPRNDYRSFQRLTARAGLRRARLHDLRHTAASLLLAEGVPARVVMEILGHSQISVTLNTYTHVDPSLTRVAASRMEEALWPTED